MESQGEFLVFLNNDTIVTHNWLNPLMNQLKNDSRIVAIQPKLLYPNGRIQCAGVDFDEHGFGFSCLDGQENLPQMVLSGKRKALTAACLVIKAKDFIDVQGFNPLYVNGQEDTDLCLKLLQLDSRRYLWFCMESIVIHYTSKSQGRKNFIHQNRAVFKYFWETTLRENHMIGNKQEVRQRYLALGNSAYHKNLNNISKELYLYASHTVPILKDTLCLNILRILERQGESVDISDIAQMQESHQEEKDDLYPIVQKVILDSSALQVEANLEQLSDEFYLATSNDPIFLLQGELNKIQAGFYGISFFILRDLPLTTDFARLYIDYGQGFSEEHVVSLNLSRGLNSRVIYFSAQPIALRFDPLETETNFLLTDFKLSKVNEQVLDDYFDKIFKSFKLPKINGDIFEKYEQYDRAKCTLVSEPYKLWRAKNEVSYPSNEQVTDLIKIFKEKILFSIIIPTYNTEGKYLKEGAVLDN